MGNKLKQLREERGYTTRFVAKNTDISASELCKIENGKRKKIKADVLLRLCKLYEVDPFLFLD